MSIGKFKGAAHPMSAGPFRRVMHGGHVHAANLQAGRWTRNIVSTLGTHPLSHHDNFAAMKRRLLRIK